MTIQECYLAMGADYDSVFRRLRKDERIEKFLRKVPADPSYDMLCNALENRNMEEAFRAAHTLKGICQNLSLTALYESSAALTERLRGGAEYGEDIEPMLAAVKADHDKMLECVQQL